MKNAMKRKCAVLLTAVMIPTLAACQNTITESFDTRLPWIDDKAESVVASYEKLVYSVNIFDTSKGAGDDVRVNIASGELVLELAEQANRRFTDLTSSFTVTYNGNAAEADRGLTDTVTSEVTFQTNSLFTSTMKKTVALAPREGKTDMSYTVEADYFEAHKAKKYPVGKPDEAVEMEIPTYGTYHDNEMMFYLARATSLAAEGSSPFFMTNIFDSFLYGEFTNYTMTASCAKELVTLYMDDWVKDLGVEGATTDDGKTVYPVSCYNVSVGISAEKHGPPYNIQYTEKPFVTGSDEAGDKKEHNKIPVSMAYPEYTGSTLARITEYKLTSCAFEKE